MKGMGTDKEPEDSKAKGFPFVGQLQVRRETRLEDTCFELETDGATVSSKDPGNICYFYCYGERNAGIKPRTLYILDKFFVFVFFS